MKLCQQLFKAVTSDRRQETDKNWSFSARLTIFVHATYGLTIKEPFRILLVRLLYETFGDLYHADIYSER
jgi:hypothetical protein